MVTFNVNSLDFVDNEEARFGAGGDFSTRYNSTSDSLEIEDRVNSAIASIPRGTSTDLVGGKFAETVSEGKALSDNGQVYDSIQTAVDNASSWVKVGPGDFRESVKINTAGLTLQGSGDRTVVESANDTATILCNASDITVSSLTVSNISDNIPSFALDGDNNDSTSFTNVTLTTTTGGGIRSGPNGKVVNCTFSSIAQNAIFTGDNATGNVVIANNTVQETTSPSNNGNAVLGRAPNIVVVNNVFKNTSGNSIQFDGGGSNASEDSIIYGNRIDNVSSNGILFTTTDTIVAKNRVSNVSGDAINDQGTGTVLDANLTT